MARNAKLDEDRDRRQKEFHEYLDSIKKAENKVLAMLIIALIFYGYVVISGGAK